MSQQLGQLLQHHLCEGLPGVLGTQPGQVFRIRGRGIPLLCLHTAGSDGRQYRGLLNDERIAKIVFQKSAEGQSMLEKAFEAWK